MKNILGKLNFLQNIAANKETSIFCQCSLMEIYNRLFCRPYKTTRVSASDDKFSQDDRDRKIASLILTWFLKPSSYYIELYIINILSLLREARLRDRDPIYENGNHDRYWSQELIIRILQCIGSSRNLSIPSRTIERISFFGGI